MEKSIQLYKDLILKQVNKGLIDDDSLKGYMWPYENEREFLGMVVFKDIRSVLTVLSSGDYLFSLICRGILDVDTFDSQPIASYYAFGLKRTIIEMIDNYIEFKSYFNSLINNDNLTDFTKEMENIMIEMPNNYRLFWSELVRYNYDIQRNKTNVLPLMQLLLKTSHSYINRCTYLNNQDFYEKMKTNLSKAKINHYNVDIFDVTKPLKHNRTYDIIYLSNLVDSYYKRKGDNGLTTYEDFKKMKKNLFNLVKEGGEIICTVGGNNSNLFAHSDITAASLECDEQILNVINNFAYEKERCLKLTKK